MATSPVEQGFDPATISGRTVVTSTTLGADGLPTLFLVVVEPTQVIGANGIQTPSLLSVGTPILSETRILAGGAVTAASVYYTFATEDYSDQEYTQTEGQAFVVGIPPTTTTAQAIASASAASSGASSPSASASPSSASTASTIVATAEYVYLATIAPIFTTINGQTSSVGASMVSVGIPTSAALEGTPILATSTLFTTVDANGNPKVSASLVSVGTPFPTGLINSGQPKLSFGAGVGVGIGASAGVALIAFAIFFFMRRCLAKRAKDQAEGYTSYNMAHSKTLAQPGS